MGLKNLFFRADDGTETPVDIELPKEAATPPAAPQATASPPPAAPALVNIAEHPDFLALKAQIADRDAKDKARAEAEAKASAGAWASMLEKDRRIAPAQVSGFASLYELAAQDDDASPRPAGATSRVDALKAACASLPTESERFASGVNGKQVLSMPSVAGGTESDQPNPENVARLMKLAGLAN